MAGIRIQHGSYRSTTLTLVDSKRPYLQPYECPVCHRTHLFKTYHLRLDEAGACIVSPEITDRLRSLPDMGGFSVTGEIAKPPPQRVVLGRAPELPEVTVHTTLIEPR